MKWKKCVPIVLVLFLYSVANLSANYDQLAQDAKKCEDSADLTKGAEQYYRAGMEAWDNSALETAVTLFEKSVMINQKLANKNALFNLYTNIGTIQVDLGQLETALFSYRKSLKIRQEMGDKSQIIS